MRSATVSGRASPLAAPGGADAAVLDEDTPGRLPPGPCPDARGTEGPR
ncbi:hypothetical protein ACFUN7_01925 [Streptomyces sp. NPDC057236]